MFVGSCCRVSRFWIICAFNTVAMVDLDGDNDVTRSLISLR